MRWWILAIPMALLGCPRDEDPTYVGSKSCQKCHYKEYVSWQKTKMAQAFTTLEPNQAVEAKRKAGLDPTKDYTKDAKCLKCHTTGYGLPGGYPDVGHEWTEEERERAELLKGVGCETCHGPGSLYGPYKKDHKEYAWEDVAKLGAVHPIEKTCQGCHNEESPTYEKFDFQEKIGKDTHEIYKLKYDHKCPHEHREGK